MLNRKVRQPLFLFLLAGREVIGKRMVVGWDDFVAGTVAFAIFFYLFFLCGMPVGVLGMRSVFFFLRGYDRIVFFLFGPRIFFCGFGLFLSLFTCFFLGLSLLSGFTGLFC